MRGDAEGPRLVAVRAGAGWVAHARVGRVEVVSGDAEDEHERRAVVGDVELGPLGALESPGRAVLGVVVAVGVRRAYRPRAAPVGGERVAAEVLLRAPVAVVEDDVEVAVRGAPEEGVLAGPVPR